MITTVTLAAGCAATSHRRPAEPSRPIGLFTPPRSVAGAELERTSSEIPPETSDAERSPGVNIRANQDAPGAANQAECSIAVNPTNPLNLVGGSMNRVGTNPQVIRFYSSMDGGQTWTDGLVPEATYTHLYDPSVTFCAGGSAYYVAGSDTPNWAVLVYRSTNGGQTWPTRSIVAQSTNLPFLDKPWITCDTTTSAFANRIYVEYMDKTIPSPGQRIRLKYSVDNGSTWSAVVTVSDGPALQNGGQVAVGPNGEVYVTFSKGNSEADPQHGVHLFDRSTNGGVSFGTDIVIHDYDLTNQPMGEGHPPLAVDVTGGPHQGTIYLVTTDGRTGDTDILLYRSTNGGTSWSAPLRVNDDTLTSGAQQFHPALVVDPEGRVIVTFYDNRHRVGTSLYKLWGAISRDGGVTFDTNFVISDVAFDQAVGWLGDYTHVTAKADRIYPVWADTRSGLPDDADVYTDRYPNLFHYDEVKGLAWLDKTQLDFQPQDARFGVNLDYDVVFGLLSELRADGGFGRATCAAPLWLAPPFVDSGVPPEGDGRYYLIRSHGPAGVGTYGDATPLSRTNVRDPLDESLATCP